MYLERYVSPARHVEVQLLGDGLRARLHATAVALGARLWYGGAGTVEFLVDPEREEFYSSKSTPASRSSTR